MNATPALLTAWDFEPSVVGGCAVLLVAYGVGALTPGPSPRGRRGLATGTTSTHSPPPGREGPGVKAHPLLFLCGVLVLFLALVSPLDVLGDTYLFSAHMAQHLLLIEIVPPLLLLGISPAMFARLLSWRPAVAVERVLGQPALAWIIGIGTVWLWHAPGMYNAALASEDFHIVEHLCFLVASTMFWWPVIAPLPERRRLPAWAAAGYLAAGALANSVLGIVLTFSPPGIYPAYLHPHDTLGLLPLIRDDWGLTPVGDQRLGGGLMWMLGSLVYLLAIVLTVARWFGEADSAYEAGLAWEEGAR
jgi:cytochrome c oxidase assembly factor CtaG